MVDGIPNAPCMKIAEELDVALRRVTGRMFGSDTGENVLRLLQITQI
jgi:hypothetical protein